MESLDTSRQIDPEALGAKDCFPALLDAACRCGLLSEKELAGIETGLLAVLAGQAERWSRGESSSIPAEKAEELLRSVLFVTGVQLKAYHTPEQAVEALRSELLAALFERGMERVRRKTEECRRLQKEILQNLFRTPNGYYRSTVKDGIDGFFRLYRPQFAAYEIHITADYPVLLGRPESVGIEFIEEYLRRIQAENAFCIRFAPQYVHRLLCALTPDYANIPMNLFEPVLLAALGLATLGRSPERLDLTEAELSGLSRRFAGASENDVQRSLAEALRRLDDAMRLPPLSLEYASLCLPKLAFAVRNAAALGTLDKVFLLPVYE